MYDIIVIVTNDNFVANSFMSKFTDNEMVKSHALKETIEIEDINKYSDIISCWYDNVSGTYKYYRESFLEKNVINIISINFAGFAYLVNHARETESKNRYGVISIREKYNTQLVGLKLYDLFIDSKFKKLSFSILKSIIIDDKFMDPEYNKIIDMISNNEISQLSFLTSPVS